VNATNELALFAELGAAFAGFIAIFLIFARREGRFSPADSLRIESIVLASFSVVFYSLIPLVLARAVSDEAMLWRAASLVALVSGLLEGSVVARRQLALSPEERATVGAGHSLVTWGLFGVAAILFSWNAIGLTDSPAAWPYLASLACILGIAAMNFVTIAFQRLL
jgi:hypothetical protein